MKTIFFEDTLSENLSPLNLLRPNFEIKSGIYSLLERNLKVSGDMGFSFSGRKLFSDYVKSGYGNFSEIIPQEKYFLLNSRYIIDDKFFDYVKSNGNCIIADKGYIVAGVINGFHSENISIDYLKESGYKILEFSETGLKTLTVIDYPWDVMRHFSDNLNKEIEIFLDSVSDMFTGEMLSEKSHCSVFENKCVYVSGSAKLYPQSVYDASGGKIVIDENAVIEPFCFVKGPAYIGKNCILKSGTRIYGPVCLGIHSRVAGEISSTLFHGYSNKQHDGFIGNSYVAEFVNLGADTVTSNLKNNYSIIKTRNLKDKPQQNTNMQFLGSIIGDHTKTGINTMLNTGSVLGIFALIAGGGFPDKFIDSFSWYIMGKQPIKYKIDDALETAKFVMSRRNVEMSKEYENIVRSVYNNFFK